jgi:hypothetical protein
MAHFAELDENNIVTRIIVVNNSSIIDNTGHESEAKGIQYCKNLFRGEWVQTSYNSTFRGRYASAGSTYDSTNDVFIDPQPYPSWVLDDVFDWGAPVAKPSDGQKYDWNEETLSWDLIAGI